MFESIHCHTESFLTSSTLESFINRSKELNRTYFPCTDQGFLYSSLKAYNLAKKNKLKPVLGLEFFFKDPSCDIITNSKANRCKYFTGTIYCLNQEAYQALIKLVSRNDFQNILIHGEKQNLFTWRDLEYLSKYDTYLILGGLHDIVGKAYIASDANVALKLFEKLKNIFNNKIAVSILTQEYKKKYSQLIEINYKDMERDSILATDKVTTDKARKIKAIDLINRPGHNKILSKIVAGLYFDVNKVIESVNLRSGFLPLEFDILLKINKFLKLLADRFQIPVLVSDYSFYSTKEDKTVQNIILEITKIHSNQHMQTHEEILDYLEKIMGLSLQESYKIIDNNLNWLRQFDNFELKYEWRLANIESPLKKAMEIIKQNGRMKWDNPIYVSRLKTELDVIAKNGVKDLTSYFLPIVEVIEYYKKLGHLTSVGRGSAGGSLFCYLLGITNIDPILHDLPFERFFSMTRIKMRKLPDIDVDLPQKDTLIGKDGHSGFLYEKWGNQAGHISTRHTLRLRSAIKDTDRYFNGKVSKETERFVAGLPQSPQGVSDKDFIFGYENTDDEHVPGLIETNEDLQKWIELNPKSWDIVSRAMGITRAFSRHACATVLSDCPIDDVLPIKEGYITHYEHKEVESAGLVKYDFLTISQLLDIEICLKLINKKNKDNFEPGYFTHKGKKTYIWDLPNEEEVYKSVWNGDTTTIFQINSKGMSELVQKILPKNIYDLSSVLALERPGPKDYKDPITGRNMVEEYIVRRNKEIEPDIKQLATILPETYGVMCFQEDLGKVAKQLAGFNSEEAETLRENMAKKKMTELQKTKPFFIEGACKKVSFDVAEKIWEQMVTFGRYGFSIIHSLEYAMITYSCMFLRHNYPLEWWAAILTNASEQEITSKLWKHVKNLIAAPDINISTEQMEPDYLNNKIRSKLSVIRGLGDSGIESIIKNRPYINIQDFVNKEVCGPSLAHKLIHIGVLDSLFSKTNLTLEEKLRLYENAVEIKKFQDKKIEAEKEGKLLKQIQPKEAKIPEEYINLHPLKDASMKKQTLPILMVDLYALGCKYSSVRDSQSSNEYPKVYDDIWNKSIYLIDGSRVEYLDKELVQSDIYVAACAYIIEAKEFSYSKGTKRALKLIVDFGNGNVSERVLWPDYKTGDLSYPSQLKRGSIATLFLRKKAYRSDPMNITRIAIDYSSN